jgi:hypothetical protein
MKIRLFGAALQTNGLVAPGELLTRKGLSTNSVPDPFRGMKSFEKADRRIVLIVPGPVLRMLPLMFQFPLVSPAFCTGGVVNLITAES